MKLECYLIYNIKSIDFIIAVSSYKRKLKRIAHLIEMIIQNKAFRGINL